MDKVNTETTKAAIAYIQKRKKFIEENKKKFSFDAFEDELDSFDMRNSATVRQKNIWYVSLKNSWIESEEGKDWDGDRFERFLRISHADLGL